MIEVCLLRLYEHVGEPSNWVQRLSSALCEIGLDFYSGSGLDLGQRALRCATGGLFSAVEDATTAVVGSDGLEGASRVPAEARGHRGRPRGTSAGLGAALTGARGGAKGPRRLGGRRRRRRGFPQLQGLRKIRRSDRAAWSECSPVRYMHRTVRPTPHLPRRTTSITHSVQSYEQHIAPTRKTPRSGVENGFSGRRKHPRDK